MANEIKNVEAPPANLGDIMQELAERHSETGLDRVRTILAMRMNQYTDIVLDKKDISIIAKSFMDIEVGSATNLVMICSKKECLYKDRCALYKASKAPEGRECLHENKILTVSMDRYLASMDVDLDNHPEMVMINQLVEYELLEYRCNAILSYEHKNMMMESVVGIDDDGRVVTKDEISHAYQIKERMFKNKMQILQEFTATRKEKYKKAAALKESKDGPAKTISSMKSKLEEMKQKELSKEDVKHELTALADIDDMGDIYDGI